MLLLQHNCVTASILQKFELLDDDITYFVKFGPGVVLK